MIIDRRKNTQCKNSKIPRKEIANVILTISLCLSLNEQLVREALAIFFKSFYEKNHGNRFLKPTTSHLSNPLVMLFSFLTIFEVVWNVNILIMPTLSISSYRRYAYISLIILKLLKLRSFCYFNSTSLEEVWSSLRPPGSNSFEAIYNH